MKTVSPGFLSMLGTAKSLVMADLYTITLSDGTVLRYTSADIDIAYSGHTYLSAKSSNAPGFQRTSTRCAVGLSVDTLEVDILFDANSLMNGVAPASFAAQGGLDNAVVKVDKTLAPDWTSPVVNGVVNLFTGEVSDVEIETGKINLTVSSRLRRLNSQFPRNYFLPSCNHSLFDAGCTLSAATYAQTGTVSGTPTKTTFTSGISAADDYFALGYVVWTSGGNTGLRSVVKSYKSNVFTIIYPLGITPSAGDTFTAYPGCDKSRATCNSKFSNLAHFRGFPYVPTPEVLELGGQGSGANQNTHQGAGVGSIGKGPGGQLGRFQP